MEERLKEKDQNMEKIKKLMEERLKEKDQNMEKTKKLMEERLKEKGENMEKTKKLNEKRIKLLEKERDYLLNIVFPSAPNSSEIN